MITFYYLDRAGDLNYCPTADFPHRENWIVRCFQVDTEDRFSIWLMLVDALSLGAKPEGIDQMARKWKIDDIDAHEFAKLAGIILDKIKPIPWKDKILWRATLAHLEKGVYQHKATGRNALEAMANLFKFTREKDKENMPKWKGKKKDGS